MSIRHGERLIYAQSTNGHRQSYLDALGALFGLEPMFGKIDHRLFRRLVAAESVLFATLDDHVPSFLAVAGARTLRGRHTAALFLRAQKCFVDGRWYHPVKRNVFRVLKSLPGLTLASITPFSVMPRHREVAHAGVVDPQYWDLHDGIALRSPARSALAEDVLVWARGRHVMCALGTIGLNKGVAFLAETLQRHPELADKILVVAAGHVSTDAVQSVAKMADAGALIIDRFVSNDELESLYTAADSVWACYTPDYDQASGIFGRAVQFGVTPVLRAGAITEAFARVHGVDHVSVAYGNPEALAALLANGARRTGFWPDPERVRLIGDWRRRFVDVIGTGLLPTGRL
jgi:hypothetical protein